MPDKQKPHEPDQLPKRYTRSQIRGNRIRVGAGAGAALLASALLVDTFTGGHSSSAKFQTNDKERAALEAISASPAERGKHHESVEIEQAILVIRPGVALRTTPEITRMKDGQRAGVPSSENVDRVVSKPIAIRYPIRYGDFYYVPGSFYTGEVERVEGGGDFYQQKLADDSETYWISAEVVNQTNPQSGKLYAELAPLPEDPTFPKNPQISQQWSRFLTEHDQGTAKVVLSTENKPIWVSSARQYSDEMRLKLDLANATGDNSYLREDG